MIKLKKLIIAAAVLTMTILNLSSLIAQTDPPVQQIGIILLFLMISLAVILILLKILKNKTDSAGEFRIKRMRIVSLIVLMVSIACILTVAFFSMDGLRKNTLANTEKNLRVVHATTQEALKIWIERNLTQIEMEANNDNLVELVTAVLKVPRNREELVKSPELKSMREYFRLINPYSFSEGFFIISPDGVNIGAGRDTNIGDRNLIFNLRPELIMRAFKGEAVFIPPSQDTAHNTADRPTGRGSIFYAVPIKDKYGKIIAVMTHREDPEKEFNRICRMSRIGETGKTYAFDKNAMLLTPSRFEENLKETGPVEKNEYNDLHVYIRNPGVDLTKGEIPEVSASEQPPTLMIREALSTGAGTNMVGYRDYRGVEVYGTWSWNSDFNFGLATEIDAEDALSSFKNIQRLVYFILIVLFLFTTGSTVFSIVVGERADKSLKKLNNDLEERVEARTSELTKAKKNLENTLEALTHPFYVINAENYHIILANSAARKASQSQELSTCYKLTHKSTKPCGGTEHPCPLAVVKKTKEPYMVEHIHFDENNQPKFIEVHGYPICDDDGNVVQMIEYSLDITDRRKAENAIRKSEERLQSLLEAAPDGMIIVDQEHTVLQVNGQTEKMFGYNRGELIGNPIEFLVPEALRDSHITKRSSYPNRPELRKMGLNLKLEAQHKNGSCFPVDVGLSSIETEDGIVIVSSVRDITAEKAAEKKIKQSEERLIIATENAGIATWEWYSSDDSNICSKIYTDILGITSGTRGVSEIINNGIHPEDRKYSKDAWKKLITGETDVYKLEFRYKKPDEKEFRWLFEAGKIAETDDDGKIVKVIGINQDITERKLAEIELAKAKEEAEDATRAKSDFLANMSHEIRTPMNAIIGLSHLILRTDLNNKQRDYIDKLSNASKSLLNIINDIFDFSKIETGKLEIKKVEFLLDKVLNNIEALNSQKANAKGLKLLFRIDPLIPNRLTGDDLRLEQVLLNLVSNGIKFTESGEVLVSADLIKKDSINAYIKFSVRDSGIGISSDDLSKLFMPFSQADTSTTRKYGGTGLGLAISGQIIKLMDGIIEVESTPGEGSTFFFTIPLRITDTPPILSDSAVSVQKGSYREKKILVAEDNEINQQVARELLEAFHFKVDIADNGSIAVDRIQESINQENPYDLIFMDVQMPVMNGYDSSVEIRKRNIKTPIIAMTANAMLGDREKTLEAGMNDYVSKPIDPEKLFQAIVRQLGEPEESAAEEETDSNENELSPELLKLTDFDIENALYRIGGNENLYIELLIEFSNEYTDTAEKFQQLINEEDKEPARRLVHTIKGISGNLGMTALHLSAAELEKAVKEERFNETAPLFRIFKEDLTSAFNTVKAAGLKNLHSAEDVVKTEFNTKTAVSLLKTFTGFALNRQPKPANKILDELTSLDWPAEYLHFYEEIILMTKHYKMKEAAQNAVKLEKMIEENS